ncbi:MAG TPA: glycosyltransferase family 4 protein [Chloroflexota bacterium]|nr:glycosyltransferase family 4 protein [Chloroflexota bacterium]HUM67376.1 glycosyltransferase family 4 protein [Chloroflexota bacterium]
MSSPLPPKEGIGFYVWNLSRQLTRLGHQVQIITRGQARSVRREVVEGIVIWRPTFLPAYPFHVHVHRLFVDRLLQELSAEIDLIHLHTPLVGLPNIRKPMVVTVHTPMKADVNSVQANHWLGVLAKLQAPISYRLEEQLFHQAQKMIAVSHSVAAELQDYDLNPQDVAVLGNGADTDIFSPGKGHNPDGPYFLTVGRLGPRKGLEDLVRCARLVVNHFPEVRFMIAGSGPLEGSLRTEVKKLDLGAHVQLLGHIADRAKLVNLYRGAVAYVHAAHYEGLPTVLLEAMACGRPAVTTAVSGALDVIEDGHNGLLVPVSQPQQMATAVMRLLQQPDFAKNLAEQARRTIEQKYSWRVVSGYYTEQYESVLAGAIA